MSKDVQYEIKNERIQKKLVELATYIDSQKPEGWGFTIMLFEFRGPAFFYASNADRQDMIRAMREFIKREEAN